MPAMGREDKHSTVVWAWIAFGFAATFFSEFLIHRWIETHIWSSRKEFTRLLEADLAAVVIAGLLGRTKGVLGCLIGALAAWTCGVTLWYASLLLDRNLLP
ncbi:MAG: hypothetical protein JO246_15210 [Frankiaceae bacterium]|nr:hypothetical protein [Frankiaceae bacterium]MBV9870115.1 hypothetical protein [Frankiaceae bacterium]